MPSSESMHPSGNREIDANRHRFPFCVVWTPIPVLSWIFPFVGHMGIAGSNGKIRDFVGYHVCEDGMAFGWPSAYWELSPSKVDGGVQKYDQAVEQASQEYKNHAHNIFCDNCHSHVALALNLMHYAGRSNWNIVTTCLHTLVHMKFVGFGGLAKHFGPSLVMLSMITAIIILVIR